MILVSPTKRFLNKGAIVPNEEEASSLINALTEERNRVLRSGGNQYGLLTIDQVNNLIDGLGQYLNNYVKGA